MKVGSEDGFTLLEVLVSIAILALAFGALFPIFVDGKSRSKETAVQQSASSVAIDVLNEAIIADYWQDMPRSGEHSGWTWTLTGTTEQGADVSAPDGYPLNINVKVERPSNSSNTLTSINQTVWVD